MEQCVVCKKYYLKGRGLKIHQKKSGCYSKLRDSHRKTSKSAAAVIQESNHSDNSSQVDLTKVKATNSTTIGGRDKAEEGKEKVREERKEMRLEEEIKIQEEDLYEEVRGWIEESQGIKENEKKGAREEQQRERDPEKGGDIRNWLGVNVAY